MGFLTKIPTVVKVYNSTVQMYIPEAVEIKGVSWTIKRIVWRIKVSLAVKDHQYESFWFAYPIRHHPYGELKSSVRDPVSQCFD